MLAIGSRGHVQPLVALGLGLQAKGHKARLATHAEFEGLVRNAGLDFFLIQVDSRALMASEIGQAAMEGGSKPLRSLQQFARMTSTGILQGSASCLAACRETAMIIYSPVDSYFATPIAEKLQVFTMGAMLQPLHRTRAFPSFTFPAQRQMGGLLNLLTYFAADDMLWVPYRSVVNQFRQDQLNLPSIPRRVNHFRQWQQHSPVVYAFSPSVVPKPPDWGSRRDVGLLVPGY